MTRRHTRPTHNSQHPLIHPHIYTLTHTYPCQLHLRVNLIRTHKHFYEVLILLYIKNESLSCANVWINHAFVKIIQIPQTLNTLSVGVGVKWVWSECVYIHIVAWIVNTNDGPKRVRLTVGKVTVTAKVQASLRDSYSHEHPVICLSLWFSVKIREGGKGEGMC